MTHLVLKPAVWFGVYNQVGRLVDCVIGEYLAAEIAEERSRLSKPHQPHFVVPVLITAHLPEPAAATVTAPQAGAAPPGLQAA